MLADKLGCSRRVSTGVDEQQYARAGGRGPKFGLRGGLHIVAVGGAGGEFAHRGPEHDRQARTRKNGRVAVVATAQVRYHHTGKIGLRNGLRRARRRLSCQREECTQFP